MNRKSLNVVALAALCVQPLTVDAGPITARVVKKIANQQITRRIPELSGQTGAQGPQGPQGPQGQTGAQGPQGSAGSSSTFARLFDDGTLDASASNGVSQANTSHPDTGLYCFGGIPGVVRGAIVTIDFLEASSDEAAQSGLGAFGPCPPDTQFFVVTFNPGDTDIVSNAGFSVLILK
jgi:hypothetical protein